MTSMTSMKRQFVNNNAPDWTVGADGVLVCPCGHRVEDDGRCPHGHVSPMKEMAII